MKTLRCVFIIIIDNCSYIYVNLFSNMKHSLKSIYLKCSLILRSTKGDINNVEVKEGVAIIERRNNINTKFNKKMEVIVQMFKFTPTSLGNSMWLKDNKNMSIKEERKEETIDISSNQ